MHEMLRTKCSKCVRQLYRTELQKGLEKQERQKMPMNIEVCICWRITLCFFHHHHYHHMQHPQAPKPSSSRCGSSKILILMTYIIRTVFDINIDSLMGMYLRSCVLMACKIKKKLLLDPLGWLVASDGEELSCITVV